METLIYAGGGNNTAKEFCMLRKSIFTLVVLLLCSSGLYAQTFTPRNGTAYTVNILEYKANGLDVNYPSRFPTITVTFYSDKVELKFENSMGSAYFTFFHDGSFEQSSETIFNARSVYCTGTGQFDRSGKDFVFTRSTEESDGSVLYISGKGRIR